MICNHCGATIEAGETICPDCGEPIPAVDYEGNDLAEFAYEAHEGGQPPRHRRLGLAITLVIVALVAAMALIVIGLYDSREEDLANFSDVSELVETTADEAAHSDPRP